MRYPIPFWLPLLVLGLPACSSLNPPKPGDTAEYRPIGPVEPLPPAFNNGAIFQASHSQGLFEDYKARRIGDVLTIILNERTNARKAATASTSKDSELELALGNINIAGRPVGGLEALSLFGATGSGGRSFDGAGSAAQSNQLDGRITVTVAEVLTNGNLLVQGEKWLGINQGSEYVRFRGIVRPVDISAANTVASTQVANAQVYYGGTGALADSNAQGWLSRFFNSPIFPF